MKNIKMKMTYDLYILEHLHMQSGLNITGQMHLNYNIHMTGIDLTRLNKHEQDTLVSGRVHAITTHDWFHVDAVAEWSGRRTV
ncbi:hypothetical protein ACJX0J_026516, partial [Zea mays]